MRILLYGVLGLLVVAVGGALIAPSLIDWNPFKRDLALEVKAATGREVEIAGNLDLALLPSPHLVADGVRVANARGATTPNMARIKSLRVDVRFWPLLAGRLEVETLRLVEPAIELERLADGRVNWDFSAAPAVGATRARETAMAFDIGRLIVESGTVLWRDARTHREERAEKVDATVTASSLSGPFHVTGKLVTRGTPTTVDANLGQLGTDAPVPVALRLGVRGLVVEASGTVVDSGTAPRMEGRIRANADDLGRALDLAGAPRALAAKFTVTADLKATERRATLGDIAFELGDQHGRGSATMDFGDKTRVAATLDVTRIALAPWLDVPDSNGKAKFALPADVAATLDLTVQLVESNMGPARDVNISAALDGGALRIDRAAAQLPGGTTITMGGLLTAKDGKPAFDVTMEAESAHFRGLAESAGLDVSRVPADRLLTASLAAKLKGDVDKFDVLGIDVRLDGARLTGGVAVAPGARIGLGAALTLDRLDLDAYLGSGDAGPKFTAKFWNGFDANLHASVAQLDWHDMPLAGVKLDLTLQGGKLTLREASARDVDGHGPAKLVGALDDFGSPTLVLERIEARIDDVPVTGSGKLDLTGDRPKLTAALTAGDIVLAAASDTAPAGVWSREATDFAPLRTFDADLTMDAASVSWRKWKVAAAHGTATLEDGVLDVPEIVGKLFGGAFALSGRLEAGEPPALSAKLRVTDANVGEALFSTGPGGLDLAGGTMTLSADLAARGASPYAIASTLEGTAELGVRDGTVKGFDLPAVSERLKRVNDPFDLLTLGSLFSAGESKFASLRGTFKIEDGAVRTEDLTLIAPSGAGSASAVADLPRWSLDAKAVFLLTELKESPPVTVKFAGPLDDPAAVVQSDDLRQWVVRRGLGQKEKGKPVAATPQAKPETAPKTEAKATPEPTPAPKTEAKVEAKPEPTVAPAPKSEPKTEAKADVKPETKADAKPAAKPAPKPEKKAETPPPDGKSLLKGLLDGLRP